MGEVSPSQETIETILNYWIFLILENKLHRTLVENRHIIRTHDNDRSFLMLWNV